MQVKEKEQVLPGTCMGEGVLLVIHQDVSVEHLP